MITSRPYTFKFVSVIPGTYFHFPVLKANWALYYALLNARTIPKTLENAVGSCTWGSLQKKTPLRFEVP